MGNHIFKMKIQISLALLAGLAAATNYVEDPVAAAPEDWQPTDVKYGDASKYKTCEKDSECTTDYVCVANDWKSKSLNEHYTTKGCSPVSFCSGSGAFKDDD